MNPGHRPRVFVTHSMAGLARMVDRDPLAPLHERTECVVWPGPLQPEPRALREAATDCEGLLCLLTDRVDGDVIGAARSLRVISSCSVGVDHIDVAAATARGIRVGFTPGVLTETTADLAFALLLAASRRIVEADGAVRSGAWTPDRRWQLDGFLGRDLHASTLGLVGLGPIAQAVASRAHGFGMRILGWSRSPHRLPGVEQVELDALLAGSDFVSVHVALAEETHGLIDADAFARIRPGAVLVNTSRGGIVDELALVAALRSGRVAAAGLDVFATEPLPADSPLLGLDNVVLTPHIGSASTATRLRMADLAVENLLAGVLGRPLRDCANDAELAAR
ncbi:MAG: D-glycerate dehydrogenase [Deltaproteobacteria bacterium]|jgi:glyoxylate reductase|nr:D-glycerate dehydrogenase [Deltaproteobacteria bacterium]MBW2385013.1 D-glycerate dehydrogenase [Deltaproteobacteria bacterium]MBW2695916.1 D-glycerate dehydrogenase [Deltaproteobacteria bacterium]